MAIHEGRDILEVRSPYLGTDSKKELERLLEWSGEEGNRVLAYDATDMVAASLRGAKYGVGLLEKMARDISAKHFGVSEEEIEENEAARKETESDLKRDFAVRGVYFDDSGFLGFIFQRDYAMMIQVPEPGASEDRPGGRAIPYFRHDDGRWVGRDYIDSDARMMGGTPPGHLGKKFAEFLEGKLEKEK